MAVSSSWVCVAVGLGLGLGAETSRCVVCEADAGRWLRVAAYVLQWRAQVSVGLLRRRREVWCCWPGILLLLLQWRWRRVGLRLLLLMLLCVW